MIAVGGRVEEIAAFALPRNKAGFVELVDNWVALAADHGRR